MIATKVFYMINLVIEFSIEFLYSTAHIPLIQFSTMANAYEAITKSLVNHLNQFIMLIVMGDQRRAHHWMVN